MRATSWLVGGGQVPLSAAFSHGVRVGVRVRVRVRVTEG